VTQLASEPDLEPVEVIGFEEEEPRRSALANRLGRPIALLRNIPHVATWAGVVLSAIGLVLIAVAWGRTAGEIEVGLQVPYVVSAAFTGLGLVVIGLAIVSIDAKRSDSAERTRQIRELREALADLRQTLEDQR
jgi:hypothetical protein